MTKKMYLTSYRSVCVQVFNLNCVLLLLCLSFFVFPSFVFSLLVSFLLVLCAKPRVTLQGQDARVPIQLLFFGFDFVGCGIDFSGVVLCVPSFTSFPNANLPPSFLSLPPSLFPSSRF